MRSIRRRSATSVDEENPYWISFSDVMAGLLVIFMLAVIALIIELTELKNKVQISIDELAKAEEVRRDLLREIEAELNEKNIPVTVSDNDTVLRIPEDVLTFRSRSFDVPADSRSQEVTLEIGKVLYASIVKEERWKYLDTIFVEGHTDRLRYSNKAIKGNWGLSTFRAISVWELWNERLPIGGRLDELRNHTGHNLFSVSGFAETRPIPCSNADTNIDKPDICPDGRIDEKESLRKNRRIDIRFTVKRPTAENYRDIKRVL